MCADILITGAAGKTGRAVIRALAQRGRAVRALVRRPDQGPVVEALGAQEIVAGDMRDAATLSRAAEGVRAIYHICPNVSPDEVSIGGVAIAASRVAGVEHFVYHSVLHPQTKSMPHHWLKLRVEEQLLASGVPYTILQPAAYMQNVLAQWGQITEQGIFPVPYHVETRLGMVDLLDVAKAAAVVLTEPGHTGATYELAGPEGEYQVTTLLKMFRYYDQHGFWGNPNVLRWLLGRPATMFDAFVARTLRGTDTV
jgi:uncharacterized protein YbjT (DUF2867 family)